MTSNCLVPRHEMLALLDDLRNALPVEIDDAQDVLDKQDEIIRGAEERADNTINEANAQATDMSTRRAKRPIPRSRRQKNMPSG